MQNENKKTQASTEDIEAFMARFNANGVQEARVDEDAGRAWENLARDTLHTLTARKVKTFRKKDDKFGEDDGKVAAVYFVFDMNDQEYRTNMTGLAGKTLFQTLARAAGHKVLYNDDGHDEDWRNSLALNQVVEGEFSGQLLITKQNGYWKSMFIPFTEGEE